MHRVYFARAIDQLEPATILDTTREVAADLAIYGMQLVDPYTEVKLDLNATSFEDKAKGIVEGDLALLKTADAVLMDLSIQGRSYIGCICELVYAFTWNIPSVVYVGDSGNDNRYWLCYHATKIHKERRTAIGALADLLGSQHGRSPL